MITKLIQQFKHEAERKINKMQKSGIPDMGAVATFTLEENIRIIREVERSEKDRQKKEKDKSQETKVNLTNSGVQVKNPKFEINAKWTQK